MSGRIIVIIGFPGGILVGLVEYVFVHYFGRTPTRIFGRYLRVPSEGTGWRVRRKMSGGNPGIVAGKIFRALYENN